MPIKFKDSNKQPHKGRWPQEKTRRERCRAHFSLWIHWWFFLLYLRFLSLSLKSDLYPFFESFKSHSQCWVGQKVKPEWTWLTNPCTTEQVRLAPWPGAEPVPWAVEVWSPNHWAAREFLHCFVDAIFWGLYIFPSIFAQLTPPSQGWGVVLEYFNILFFTLLPWKS